MGHRRPAGDLFLCIAEGFPSAPFFVDKDLTRSDGIIQCRALTTAEAVRAGWRAWRLLKLLVDFIKAVPF